MQKILAVATQKLPLPMFAFPLAGLFCWGFPFLAGLALMAVPVGFYLFGRSEV